MGTATGLREVIIARLFEKCKPQFACAACSLRRTRDQRREHMKIHIKLPGGGFIRIDREPMNSERQFCALAALIAILFVAGMLGFVLIATS